MQKLMFLVFFACILCIGESMVIQGEDYVMNIVASETSMEVDEIENDPLIMDGIEKAVDTENKKGNNFRRFVRHSVLGGSKELHEMEIYRIRIKLVESSCRNNEINMGRPIEECPAVENGVTEKCHMTLTTSPWSLITQDTNVEEIICQRTKN